MALIGSLLEGEDGIFGGHLRLRPQWIPIDLVRNQHKADEDDPDFHVCSIQGHEIGSAWLLPRAPKAYVYGYVEIRLAVMTCNHPGLDLQSSAKSRPNYLRLSGPPNPDYLRLCPHWMRPACNHRLKPTLHASENLRGISTMWAQSRNTCRIEKIRH